ncbi:hypothetical protein SAMN04489724_3818 [Algoriphagus locisalis]|uniref:TolB-like 6-blade propeller-like n=1 Tax=Algoriphagus locisalis TaxID=305507 RepID=A0A1I7D9W0_9BACT|nr:hypothetical protein [Algoriphagus locisalis]SFU08512.1 hypothetical protein SAMN04489724_3818 [Algoriphagus locisalis]
MKLTHTLLILLVFSFFACESPTSSSSSGEKTTLTLEIADSIRVNYIGKLNLMDVNPEFKMILFFDPQNMKFVSTDFEGKILGEFSKDRDAPDGFGFFPMAAGRFNASQNIQIVSMFGIYEYDLDGNLLTSHKIPKDEVKSFSGRADAKREIQFVNDKILLSGSIARGEFNKTQPEFYDTYLQLVWADPKTGAFEQFLSLDSASIFQNNMSHEPTTLSTSFDVVNDQLYVISGIDPFLNIYEIEPPYTKLKRIPLQLTNYRLNQGEDPKKADPRAISYDPSYGIIHKLVKVGDKLVIMYETGYSEEDAIRSHENMSQSEWEEFYSRMKEKYKIRYQILDFEGKLLSDAEIPGKLSDLFVARDGTLWFLGKANAEVEEDFYTLYKVEIE